MIISDAKIAFSIEYDGSGSVKTDYAYLSWWLLLHTISDLKENRVRSACWQDSCKRFILQSGTEIIVPNPYVK